MRFIGWPLAALLMALNPCALVHAEAADRTVKAQSGKPVAVGAYINVKPDCSAGALPTIRLIKEPIHGKVVVKKGNAKATNYKKCLALEVPAYVVLYSSEKDFIGTDFLTVEVRFPAGRTEIQNITVTVASQQQNI
jgi:hypothetical protein